MSVTWRYLSGDTAVFAVEFTLVADDSADGMVEEDERNSWGSFAIWIHGVNLCEHHVQGEILRSAHWYLLPIAEWFAANWEPLLHEERIPVPDGSRPPESGTTAARGYARMAIAAEQDVLDRGETARAELTQDWYNRHGLRAAAPGALLPDAYIRRHGDRIEFSTTADPPAGTDWGITFNQVVDMKVDVTSVASALHDGLTALIERLRRRHPSSRRYGAVAESLSQIAQHDREPERIAWLAGAAEHIRHFTAAWRQAQLGVPAELRAALKRFVSSTSLAGGLAIGAPPAALLFGSVAPTVSGDDMATLFTALLSNRGRQESVTRLRQIGGAIVDGPRPVGISPQEKKAASTAKRRRESCRRNGIVESTSTAYSANSVSPSTMSVSATPESEP